MQTPIIKGLTSERVNGGPLLLRLHYTADPMKDPATPEGRRWVEEAAKDYPDGGTQSPGWRREMEMDPTAGAGELVFPFLDRLKDVLFVRGFIQKMKPEELPLLGFFGGFDVGRSNPTALLVAAMLPNKTLVFFWEFYKRHVLLNDMAMSVTGCPWYTALEWISCDPSIWDRNQYKKDGMTSLAQMLVDEVQPEYRIDKMMKAHGRNDQVFIHKFSAMATNMRKDEATGLMVPDPKVLIDEEGCPNFSRELRGARYKEAGIDRNASEKMVDKDNHLIDCAKYIISSHPETHSITAHHRPGTVGDVVERERIARIRAEEFGMSEQEMLYG